MALMLKTEPVQPSKVSTHWRDVRDWVSAACDATHGELVPSQVRKDLDKAGYRLVLLRMVSDNELVGVLVLDHTEPGRMHITSLAGRLPPKWHDDLWVLLRRLAQDCEATVVTCKGRRGWDRVLPSWGFEQASDGVYFRRV